MGSSSETLGRRWYEYFDDESDAFTSRAARVALVRLSSGVCTVLERGVVVTSVVVVASVFDGEGMVSGCHMVCTDQQLDNRLTINTVHTTNLHIKLSVLIQLITSNSDCAFCSRLTSHSMLAYQSIKIN
jgi:hypothetical protein